MLSPFNTLPVFYVNSSTIIFIASEIGFRVPQEMYLIHIRTSRKVTRVLEYLYRQNVRS